MKDRAISDIENKQKTAIIVVGYNRLRSMQRLLSSLAAATYPDRNIPLIISIDRSGNGDLYRYVSDFEWQHGDKYVFIQKERFGLKKHIFWCGDLSRYFRAVIILEDDVFVARDFYRYMITAVDKYDNEEKIACISGYFNDLYGYTGMPYTPMSNYDVFAMQEVSSTGECFTQSMWRKFRDWLSHYDLDDFDMERYELPDPIKRWRRAWTKFYNAYMVEKDLYCIYPIHSTITNCGDVGEHNACSVVSVQTPLMTGRRDYSMPDFSLLPQYDIFGNNRVLYDFLNLPMSDLCLDLYGNNPNVCKKRYVLTINKLPFLRVRSFGLSFRPQELNVMMGIEGSEIGLYDTEQPTGGKKKRRIPDSVINYHLHGFNIWFLLQVVVGYIKKGIKKRLHLKV